jgi:cytochrome P450
MPTTAGPSIVATRDVDHVPGRTPPPLIGDAWRWLTDARGLARENVERYGPVHRTSFLSQHSIGLAGPDMLQRVLLDREQVFSSRLGWQYTLGQLFTRGLMLRDFDDHRYQRRIMQAAFRREALADYAARIGPALGPAIDAWGEAPDFRFYTAIKRLTLDLAADVFLGLELGAEADRVNRAFMDTVAASMAVIRKPVPGLAFWRGLRGRAYLADFFARLIRERRGAEGADMLTRLCHATSEDGDRYDDQEIIDHMIFLMMAAHDTVTSSLTTTAWALARHPEWQERVREEALSFGTEPPDHDALDRLTVTDHVFNEALRLYGPVPFIPRRTVREVELGGYRIPANAQVIVYADLVHHDPSVWSEPERFDPERFSDERAEHKRHAFAFVPYGGGAHKCLGMHFAGMLSKLFLHQFAQRYRWSLPAGYRYDVRQVPIPKPADGLALRLERLAPDPAR